MYEPVEDDEITTVVRYADQQLAAIRASVHGLSEEQSRASPCRSSLSPAGLVKHVTRAMSRATQTLTAAPGAYPSVDPVAHEASFVLGPQETVRTVLDRFDAVRVTYLATLARTDPDGVTSAPAPWVGVVDGRPARWRFHLLHQIEELTRHAGHADILREQVDGALVPALVTALEASDQPDA